MEHAHRSKDHPHAKDHPHHKPGKSSPDTHFVSISVDSKGMPQVDTDSIRLKEGDTLKFVGDLDFSIRFPHDSPKCDKHLHSRRGTITIKTPDTICSCDGKREALRYKYDVIIGEQVLDPEIVIEPR